MRRGSLIPALGALLALSAGLPASAAAKVSPQTFAQTEAKVTKLLKQLKGSTGIYAREQSTGLVLASKHATVARTPASVTKLFTLSSVLLSDPPATTLPTELLSTGAVDASGTLHGNLILKGDGDPSLRAGQLTTLALGVQKAGIKKLDGTLQADLSGWTTDIGTPLTGGRFDGDLGGRMGALVVGRGFAQAAANPAAQAIALLRAQLHVAGLKGTIASGKVIPATIGAPTKELAVVQSPTLAQLAAATLLPSDNYYAEMLLRGLGARHGAAGTTAAGLAVERAKLAPLGVSPVLYDGSGLNHSNHVAPTTIVRLLDAMSSRPAGATLRASLPVAGASGTLAGRMGGTAAAGRCRAKTGTLTGVSGLAGWCKTIGGRTVTFAILQNGISVNSARALQDRFAEVFAAWTDRAGTSVATPTPTPNATTTPAPATTATTPATTAATGGVVS